MKLKSKLMAAAIALVAASSANATITFGANGELFFTVYDRGANLSDVSDDRAYVRDLGEFMGSFGVINDWATTATSPVLAANKQFPGVQGTIDQPPSVFTIGADSNLQSFLSGTTDASRLQWNIVAGDNSGVRRLLTTSNNILSTEAPTYAEYRTTVSRIGTYLPFPNNNGIVENGSVLLSGSTAGIDLWGDAFAASAKFTNTAGIGDQLGFYLLSETVSTGSTTTRATIQQYMGQGEGTYWHLSSAGNLTYNVAAVPEPSEYALMLAGLGMIGFMARRRLNNRA